MSRSSGQVTHVLLTRSRLCPRPKPGSSLHLHVLSTPPAFVLSQDQTLRKRPVCRRGDTSLEELSGPYCVAGARTQAPTSDLTGVLGQPSPRETTVRTWTRLIGLDRALVAHAVEFSKTAGAPGEGTPPRSRPRDHRKGLSERGPRQPVRSARGATPCLSPGRSCQRPSQGPMSIAPRLAPSNVGGSA